MGCGGACPGLPGRQCTLGEDAEWVWDRSGEGEPGVPGTCLALICFSPFLAGAALGKAFGADLRAGSEQCSRGEEDSAVHSAFSSNPARQGFALDAEPSFNRMSASSWGTGGRPLLRRAANIHFNRSERQSRARQIAHTLVCVYAITTQLPDSLPQPAALSFPTCSAPSSRSPCG